ncbi:MAG TPA: nitronate monooxygenase [Candidatus Stackebrandtia faecavium]|nr:nitronate monooxygenase [Candidatus Stackebrandtia faecavium]
MSTSLLDSTLPIVAAPMAGGPSTVVLARAVASAGGFPFLAGGYKSPASLAAQIEEVRELSVDFGVNLFVPSPGPVDEVAFAAYVEELKPEAEEYGIELDPSVVVDDDYWQQKLSLLVERPVPVVSFTFGLPHVADIAALHRAGSRVIASVTMPSEAQIAHEAGVDGLAVQGASAGGHSAIFDPARAPVPVDTATLVRQVRDVVDLPVIAAGGVDGPESVRRLRDSGAQAVAVGTLLLRTDEAGTSPTHKRALGDTAFTETVLTRAFTGRPARSLHNGFIARHHETAPNAYPAVHHLTRKLRRAASEAGDAERLHLWAGTGWRNARSGPAADVIHHLAEGI